MNEEKREIEEIQNLLSQQKVQTASKLLQELHEARPHDHKVLVLLGIAELKQNNFALAEDYFLQAIARNDKNSEAHFQLADVYLHQGQFDKAIEQYQKVSLFDAVHLQAEIHLGEAFESNWRFFEAELIYKRVLQEEPHNAMVLERLACVLKKLGKISESVATYQKALEAAPKEAALLNHLGTLYQEIGDFQNAVAYFEKALALKPENVEALFGLALSRQQDKEHIEAKKLESLSQKNLPLEEEMLAHFGLGKVYDDKKEIEKAFFHFQTANQLCARKDPFNISSISNTINNVTQTFNTKFIHEKKIVMDFDKMPIFIVGIPLSGKHLLKKTLATHPQIAFVGEQRLLLHLIKESWHLPALMQELTSDELKKIAEDYVMGISKLALKEAPFFCDTMPSNHLLLGVIAILFPQAKIIHCTRHPLDLCLANYTQYQNTPKGFAHDLAVFGRYYQLYAKLMGYWQSIGINHRIEVRYDEWVQSPKNTLKELFAFLELPFEENNFSLPSFDSNQVGRWEKYQVYLQPLIDVLYKS